MTPRYHPWAILEVSGDARPYVVVLSQTDVSFEDVRSELDRVLTRDDPSSLFAALPEEVVDDVGREGEGSLAVAGERGPVVLPVRWRAEEHALYAALPAETLALAGADPDVRVALTVDKPSVWRARDMVGAMIQGEAACFVDGVVGSGAKTMRQIAGAIATSADALVRIEPSRVVWWKGWTSGSARLP
jgi:hypothetical protein